MLEGICLFCMHIFTSHNLSSLLCSDPLNDYQLCHQLSLPRQLLAPHVHLIGSAVNSYSNCATNAILGCLLSSRSLGQTHQHALRLLCHTVAAGDVLECQPDKLLTTNKQQGRKMCGICKYACLQKISTGSPVFLSCHTVMCLHA